VSKMSRSLTTRRSRRSSRPRIGVGLLMFVLILVVSDCGGDDDAKPDPDERPASTTTTTLSPEQEVEQAYRDFIAMTNSVYLAPDPTDPRIAEYATGDARANLEATLTEMQAEGIHYRTGQLHNQTILSTTVSADTATLKVCYVDHSGSYDTATAREIEPMRVVTSLDTTTVVRDGEAWRVSLVLNDVIWEGEYSCAA
jgi:hypothetical protein